VIRLPKTGEAMKSRSGFSQRAERLKRLPAIFFAPFAALFSYLTEQYPIILVLLFIVIIAAIIISKCNQTPKMSKSIDENARSDSKASADEAS
jgi:H+/Cl- antiporter ClcA